MPNHDLCYTNKNQSIRLRQAGRGLVIFFEDEDEEEDEGAEPMPGASTLGGNLLDCHRELCR